MVESEQGRSQRQKHVLCEEKGRLLWGSAQGWRLHKEGLTGAGDGRGRLAQWGGGGWALERRSVAGGGEGHATILAHESLHTLPALNTQGVCAP